jgi:hypothetical protein
MRIRINIPAWGASEITAGVQSLVTSARHARESAILSRAMVETVPGWTPTPVSSGRFAVALAMRALRLEGARVAVPAYLCPAVLAGVRAVGAEAIPVDCLPRSICFDLDALSRVRVAGVLATNTYGVDQDFAGLAQLGLPVLEDAAYQAGRVDSEGRACGRGAMRACGASTSRPQPEWAVARCWCARE